MPQAAALPCLLPLCTCMPGRVCVPHTVSCLPAACPGSQFGAGLPKDHHLAKRFYDRSAAHCRVVGVQRSGGARHCDEALRRGIGVPQPQQQGRTTRASEPLAPACILPAAAARSRRSRGTPSMRCRLRCTSCACTAGGRACRARRRAAWRPASTRCCWPCGVSGQEGRGGEGREGGGREEHLQGCCPAAFGHPAQRAAPRTPPQKPQPGTPSPLLRRPRRE